MKFGEERRLPMKPMIAIVSLYDEKLESYWMLPGYAQGLEAAGAAPVILPLTTDPAVLQRYAQTFDGFLFPGGHDLPPSLYGEEPSEKLGPLVPQRDSMEQAFFPLALETGKPMLGICRGIQLFNVMLGGDLYQDIPTQCPSGVQHHETPPYDKVAHPVAIRRGTPLFDAVGVEEMGVNSYHHQGIRRLGKGLEVAATAPDGMVEAVYLPEHRFALAVQWHPEFSRLSDENSRKIFEAFVKSVAGLDKSRTPL